VTLSPFVTVVKLRLPQQDIGGEDNVEKMDATSMTPWRVTKERRSYHDSLLDLVGP
jgi:hypothetical protein